MKSFTWALADNSGQLWCQGEKSQLQARHALVEISKMDNCWNISYISHGFCPVAIGRAWPQKDRGVNQLIGFTHAEVYLVLSLADAKAPASEMNAPSITSPHGQVISWTKGPITIWTKACWCTYYPQVLSATERLTAVVRSCRTDQSQVQPGLSFFGFGIHGASLIGQLLQFRLVDKLK